MTPRDALGRRVAVGSPDEVPEISEVALPAAQALTLARTLLAEGRAFAAHEVFEAVWKACPGEERDRWQGLAQVCVGITHLQRGNTGGAATLLRRGAGHLRADTAPVALPGLTVAAVADRAEALADQVAAGAGFSPAALRIIEPGTGCGSVSRNPGC